MKNVLMMTIAAGGMLLATSNEANAQSWRSGPNSGFGVSLNFGSSQGFNNQHNHRQFHNGLGHNSGFHQNSRYRNTGFNSGFNSGFGFNNGYVSPVQGFRNNVPNRSYGYSNQYLPVQRYSPQRGFGRSCGY